MDAPFRLSFSVATMIRLADAVPVEGGVEDGFHEIAVGEVIGPLALSLETAQDGIVAQGFLAKTQFGQARVADHQIAGDHGHLDHAFPILILLRRGCAASAAGL